MAAKKNNNTHPQKKNKIVKKDIGVEEWLGYILHADYVVTNSFHGTVFSILFNKDFYSEVSNKVNPSTNRLLSLLNAFNMNSHIINDNNDILDLSEVYRAV